jgi:hypothetical protein
MSPDNAPCLVEDKFDRVLSVVQIIMNVVFITSWIALSLLVTALAVFTVVLFFITP